MQLTELGWMAARRVPSFRQLGRLPPNQGFERPHNLEAKLIVTTEVEGISIL